MRDGYTLTRQHLTYDEREPDSYDIAADEVDPEERYVVRHYDRIVRSVSVHIGTHHDVVRMLQIDGLDVSTETPTWLDYVLLAESAHARVIAAQPETLPGL